MFQKTNASIKRPGKWIRMTAAAVAGILMISFAGPSLIGWASSSDTAMLVQQAMADQDANQERLAKIGEQEAQMTGTVNQYSGELAWLNTKNAEQVAEYKVLVAANEAALKAVDEALAAFLASEEVLKVKEAEYRVRLQVMFEYRDKSVLEVFLESGNLQSFFSNMELIRAVADYDQKMLEELETARDDAEVKRQESLRKQMDANALVEVTAAKIEELHSNIQRSSEELAAAQAQLAAQKALEAQELAESNKVAESIRVLQNRLQDEKAQEEAARKKKEAEELRAREAASFAAQKRFNSVMIWPVPSSTYITSLFQPYGRTDLPGQTAPHMGVDIGANYGTLVVAAASGFVLMVYNPWEGRNTGGVGYGNYIILDHGNRIATLYGHLRNTKVTEGAYVMAGDVIGMVGSTGNSTGAHLHFEVREDGYPVNPLQQKYIGQP